MKLGDIVWVSFGDKKKMGILVSTEKKKFMVGHTFEVLVEGAVTYVRKDRIEFVTSGEKCESK